MKRFLILSSGILLIFACGSKQAQIPVTETIQKDTSKKNYLPIADYLKSEIAAVDSFPLRIMKYVVMNGKTDSAMITTSSFDQLAKEFLMADLDSGSFEKKFDENSFIDRSTELVSFTYSTKEAGNGLKRVDVLLEPGAGADKLSSIYMESISNRNDSSMISKMSWKAGRNFRIIHIRQPKSGPETITQTMVVWDTRE